MGCTCCYLCGDRAVLRLLSSGRLASVDCWSSRVCWICGFGVVDSIFNFRSYRRRSVGYRFVRDNVQRASEFYSKHGGKAIVLARFVPVVRTFAPIVAGAARMSYYRFTISNIIGGALWVLSVTLAGYFVGSLVPAVTDYLNPLILVVILTSPLVWMLAWVWGRTKK